MSEATDPKAKQEFMTMIGHSLEIIEVDDGMLSKTNRQSIRNGILETISELMDQRDAATARAEKAEARAERYEDALQQIHNWATAYPLDVFPEPDFKRVREVLEAAGITLDSVSASNMRHVISGVARIVENALKGGEG